MTGPAGLLIMSILADTCAGKTKSRVTDRSAAYATVAKLLSESESAVVRKSNAKVEHLIPVTLRSIKMETLDLRSLIKFREREAQDSSLKTLRHRYNEMLETYLAKLTTEAASKSDAREIKRQLKDDMASDLDELKRDFREARVEVALSEEISALVIASATAVISWMAGAPILLEGASAVGTAVALGRVGRVSNKYLAARRSILQKHPMAYLYEFKRSASRQFLQDAV
jgi:hypothetical protein